MKKKTKEYMQWYLLMLVPIIGTIVFNIYPLIKTLIDSFLNSKGIFIKFVNYNILFSDKLFIQSIGNTIYMAFFSMIFIIIISFSLANILNQISKGKGIYKVIFLLPMIMSMVTVSILFKYLMNPDESGILNFIGSWFGLQPKLFFNSPDSARQSIVIMSMWKNVGYNVILFFAGLQNVPVELYEASEIDGASEWKKWTHITIPSMRGTFIFVLITITINQLKRFADIYAISGETGNPANSLSTIMLFIYKNSFSTLNYKDLGIASSASIFLFLLILLFTLLNFTMTRDRDQAKLNKQTKIAKKLRNKEGR